VTARDISENKGFASRIFKTNIYIENNPESVYNFVMKIPTSDCMNHVMDETMDKDNKDSIVMMQDGKLDEKLAQIHNVECDFYGIFKDIKGLPMARVMYTQKFLPQENRIGVIFMEDLSGKMDILGIFGSLNVHQIKTIVKHLAAFHAQLYNMEEKWKNRFPFKVIDEDFVIDDG
uniref:Uncharacterized protein n=1 Tax=Acrobeloides nanus TaxID=290746 RepID=A0A914D8M6_9BILA